MDSVRTSVLVDAKREYTNTLVEAVVPTVLQA